MGRGVRQTACRHLTHDLTGAVELHHPEGGVRQLRWARAGLGGGDELGSWGPLHHKVGEGLALDRVAWFKAQIEFREFDCPFHHPSSTLSVIQDLAEGIRRNHRDPMRLEIMAQLPRSYQDSVKHLLGLRVSGLGVPEGLTNKVDGPLHLSVGPILFARGHISRALSIREATRGALGFCADDLGVRGRQARPSHSGLGAILGVGGAWHRRTSRRRASSGRRGPWAAVRLGGLSSLLSLRAESRRSQIARISKGKPTDNNERPLGSRLPSTPTRSAVTTVRTTATARPATRARRSEPPGLRQS
uniref:Retrotransposon protein, putative, unclassified n=2 Tax=Oryza sativa subsp. japonica TaxID=39947 RepID=Q53LD5_ORYSJ|nr:retrotransposon protein, putative, unclassified [Oryza sativa Japonica Group]ABA91916.1 retrotransposon protein, putative, unclassified [Oryza sativa Japonica Group]